MNKKVLIIVIILIVVIAVLVVYYLSYRKPGVEKGKFFPGVLEVGGGGSTVDIGAVTANPLENMPSVNPYEEVVNPFKESYKNPFE